MNKKKRPQGAAAPRSRSKKTDGGRSDDNSGERLRLLSESFSDVAIISMDADGKVQDWNPGAEAIFEYTEADIVGRSADAVFTPEDRAARVPQKERATALKKGRASDERWHVRRDGSRFFASGVMVPLFRGSVHQGFAKIARDLTASIAAESNRIELEMLKRLVDAQEAERTRIARDLHDVLGQQITALRLKLEVLKANYGADSGVKLLEKAQQQAREIDDEVSFLTWELRPTVIDTLGLSKALAAFVRDWSKNYKIEAEFHTAFRRRSRLVPEIEINLYRIAQEALNNVLKHAKATRVDIALEFVKKYVVLVVEDNGVGFDVKAAAKRSKQGKFGVIGMRERAALVGGTLEIESAPSKGTTVIARIPARVAGGVNKKKLKLRDKSVAGSPRQVTNEKQKKIK